MQLVLDAELVSLFRRLHRGSEVTAETIGYDVIKEASQTGIFLDQPHTVAHHKGELWQGACEVNSITYAEWVGREEQFGYAAARQKVLGILETHHPHYLLRDLRSELEAVIKRAASDIAHADLDDRVFKRPWESGLGG